MADINRAILTGIAIFVMAMCTAHADVMKNVRETGVLKIGYREDAEPFSFINSQGVPAGYSISLCRAVESYLKSDLKLTSVKAKYVPVNSADRFKKLQEGEVDLLCGATSATLKRRELVDFSIPTFITGATVMVRRDGPQSLADMKGRKIGVLAATTTAEALLKTLEKFSVNAEVVPVSSHNDGFAKLQNNEISAYFGDRAILVTLVRRLAGEKNIGVSTRLFSLEPYAIGLPRGDSNFRLVVDAAISKVFRSPQIQKIYQQAFGNEPPSDLLKALFVTGALPD
ncbi:MAG: amino acid ABC transporter substrate-binding protein [Hyphomicrobiales bacterium]